MSSERVVHDRASEASEERGASEDASIARRLRALADRLDAQERLTAKERAELRWFRELWSRTHLPAARPIEPAKTALPGALFVLRWHHTTDTTAPDPVMPAELARRLAAVGRDLLLDVLWRLAVGTARCAATDLDEIRTIAAESAEEMLALAANRRAAP